MTNNVRDYIASQEKWNSELDLLYNIIQSTELKDSIKWGRPVFTIEGKNVVGMSAFKDHVALWFFNGVYLSDPRGQLINAQDGKTQSQRQLRFTKEDRIDKALVRTYIDEAIKNQREGKVYVPERKPLDIPEELKLAFKKDPGLRSSFDALNLTRKREFAEHIGSASRDSTRQSRLEKCIPLIRKGVGLHDKYRSN